MEPVRNVSSNPQEGFSFTFDWTSNSKTVSKGTTLQFKPPCLTSCARALLRAAAAFHAQLGSLLGHESAEVLAGPACS